MSRISTPKYLLALASVLFFASGCTGLAYEVIWSKRFTHIWGSSSLAMAAVVASFLFGLGLGALCLGRVADRVERPLLWYGLAEILIGVLALIIPAEILLLSNWAVWIYSVLPDMASVRFLVHCGFTLLVIGPPCFLMGGTLPLLIRQFTPRDGELGAVVGWLYGVNTLGAAMGCVVAGFYLLPSWGLEFTNYGAAALNLLIGGISVPLSGMFVRQGAQRASAPKKAPVIERKAAPSQSSWLHSKSIAVVCLATALTGLAALMLQMVWVRQLALVLGGSTYAFTGTLFIVLMGIALGSWVYQWGLQRFALKPFLPAAVILVLAVSSIAGLLLLPWLSELASAYREARWQWSVNARLCLTAAAIVQLVPSIAMGILFPLLVDRTKAAALVVGRTVGNIYAWNSLGSIAGATFTSFYFIPWLGTVGTMALALALYFVVGALLAGPASGQAQHRSWAVGFGAIGALLVSGTWFYGARIADPLDTNLGLYLYDMPKQRDQLSVDFFEEGASCNVLVVGYPAKNAELRERDLRVNGKVDASTLGDMQTQLGGAFFPQFFNPRARDILVIGYGSGTTPGACLLFPDTHVTCCEIEPAVFAASPQFARVNHRPEEHLGDRFEMIFGDGRSVLQTSQKKFDLIISEPSNPWLAGVSNLFTKEFFEAASSRLNDGGVLVQWIQTYQFSVAEYALIVRTLRTVFPHAGVISLSNGSDTLLVTSHRALSPHPADIDYLEAQIASSPELQSDLDRWFGTRDVRRLLVRHFMLDERGLERFIARDLTDSGRDASINTDLNMKLEFDAPLRLFARTPADVYATMVDVMSPDWSHQLAQALGRAHNSAELHVDVALALADRGKLLPAVDEYRKAIRAAPDDVALYRELAALYQKAGQPGQAIPTLLELVERGPGDASLQTHVGSLLVAESRPGEAIAQFRGALRLDPGYLPAANNLAWLLATYPDARYRDGQEAVRLALLTCEATEHKVPLFLDTLAAAYAEVGEFELALRTLQSAVERAAQQNDRRFIAGANIRSQLYQQRQPFRDG